ncbi:unnamed protein product [Spirodela intermedia]|uniref:Dof-type domain-containing protein n=1 Tax=Spirodela intermedia TaxID=51605 RepID=A0A7I8K5V7_SPIIN|nr:unnamed protein product [Spirodela intermedia]
MEFLEKREEEAEYSELDASSTVCCENEDSPKVEEEEEGDTAMVEQGKTKSLKGDLKVALKKPDKILPCPRCNSSNTKFCYYNNYNVNQPRHFCKNCQRYWTAGGTMRNVPVGAGRRKNKSTGLHSRHSGAPKPAVAVARPARSGDNAGEPSCASSSLTASTGLEGELPYGEEQAAAVLHGADAGLPPPPPVHCYPWPVGWNGASAAAAAAAAVPFPLLPTFFWSCMSAWPASPAWAAAPWAGPASPAAVAPSSACAAAGKVAETSSIWVPKTLRIDDPDEAAKSSIWATLGINPDPKIRSGGIFRGFDPKSAAATGIAAGDRRPLEGLQVPHVNPAALSRSQAFKEST